MNRSLRLLPLTMLTAFLLLGLKIGETVRDGHLLALSFTQAHAESEAKPEPKPEAKKEGETKKEGEAPKEGEAAKEGDPKVNPPSTEGEEAKPEEPPKHEYSQVEVDLLQSLAKRRQELDDWAKQIQLKENMLVATEQRINGKLDGLQKVKKQVEDLLAQYNQQEDTKIKSLVKIYENMKPKDAARIFEELDMPVLLMVVDRMSERKVAPVLAAMSAGKAKDVTIQLAEQRKLQKNKPGAGAPPAPAAGGPESAPAAAPADTGNAPAGGNPPPANPSAPAAAPASATPGA